MYKYYIFNVRSFFNLMVPYEFIFFRVIQKKKNIFFMDISFDKQFLEMFGIKGGGGYQTSQNDIRITKTWCWDINFLNTQPRIRRRRGVHGLSLWKLWLTFMAVGGIMWPIKGFRNGNMQALKLVSCFRRKKNKKKYWYESQLFFNCFC